MQRASWTTFIAHISLFTIIACIVSISPRMTSLSDDRKQASLHANEIDSLSNSQVQHPAIAKTNPRSSGPKSIATDSRPHFRVIVLVLSSHLGPLVQNCRKVWHQYMHLHPDVKVFLVYGDSFHDIPVEGDLVYEDIEEVYNPGMLQKTVRAMEHIEKHYSYDFFLRTNIGTFWDFPTLMKHLDTLPLENCYSGDGPFEDAYLSGTDTIVNRHMIQAFIGHQDNLNYNVPEDKAMGLIFHGLLGAPFRKSRIFFMESFLTPDKEPIVLAIQEGLKNGADHYRVKNYRADRNVVDIACYIYLCYEIYGLDITQLDWTTEEKDIKK